MGQRRHFHLDPLGGVAGDMFLAALLDAHPAHAEEAFAAMRAAGLPDSWQTRLVRHDDGALSGRRVVIEGPAGDPGPAGPPGAPGEPGQDAPPPLTATADEPPGANCEFGGARIESGPDENRNGTLEAGEVTATAYACNADGAPQCDVLQGSYTIANSADRDLLAFLGCRSISGDLTVSGIESLVGLEALTSVGGTLQIAYAPDLLDLTGLGGLTSAGALVLGSGPVPPGFPPIPSNLIALGSLSGLQSLAAVQDLQFNDLPALDSLDDLVTLAQVANSFILVNLPAMPLCHAQAFVDALDATPANVAMNGLDEQAVCP